VLLLIYYLWKNLPASQQKASFKVNLIKGIWKFAAGMSGISILGIILAQLDKIVLSKLISLDEFGYYMLANAVAMTLGRLISPIFYSIYPRFTQLVVSDNQVELKNLYHKVCQLVSVFILPIAILLVFFSYEVLLLWTKNVELAQRSYIIVNILICGSAINAIMHPPYALQLAAGWTKLSFFKNIIAIIIIVPLIIFLAKQYGPVGAASAWLILNLGYLFLEIGVMHLKLLKQEKMKWYLQDVLFPLSVTIFVTWLGKYALTGLHLTPLLMALFLAFTLTVTMGITAWVTPSTRLILQQAWYKRRLFKSL
jgi:O-antigen/teichoic acid export membrane protein